MVNRPSSQNGTKTDLRQPPAAQTQILCGATGSTFGIGRELGDGGMGRVYLAQQWHDGPRSRASKLVALKLLRPDAHAQARRLFYHEGKLLPRLQHPHIVRCVEYGRGAIPAIGPLDYLALGYVSGETTDNLLRRCNAPLTPATVLGMVAQLAGALGYLHQRGIVHCDLKPSNIMLEHAAPRAVLIDFGIARAPGFVGQPVAVGTPQYMAPEQADPHAACDGRADLYALGVVIFELLTGRRLFPNRTTTDIRQGKLITMDERMLAGALDPALAQVIARCLRPIPAERYPSAAALLDDLCRAMHGLIAENKEQRTKNKE